MFDSYDEAGVYLGVLDRNPKKQNREIVRTFAIM